MGVTRGQVLRSWSTENNVQESPKLLDVVRVLVVSHIDLPVAAAASDERMFDVASEEYGHDTMASFINRSLRVHGKSGI
jgi:hypothetical protein